MSELEKIVRPNIWTLKPYSSARHEFTGQAKVFLDANENPYENGLNRYPDPLQIKLKSLLSQMKGIDPGKVFLGNGSDEAIDLIYRIFCSPAVDKVLICPPTYGMYKVSADIHDVTVIEEPLLQGFQLNVIGIKSVIQREPNLKVIWLCSPNNPSGNSLNSADIEDLIESFQGIVVVDEAYIDFSSTKSWIQQLNKHKRLIVMQTFSKAWAAAGMRLGMAFADEDIIALMNKVKAPYNINLLTQQKAISLLENYDSVAEQVQSLIHARDMMTIELRQLSIVKQVYPSDANFLLCEFEDSDHIFRSLRESGIIIRDRSNVILCGNCLRITIGTEEENHILLTALKQLAE